MCDILAICRLILVDGNFNATLSFENPSLLFPIHVGLVIVQCFHFLSNLSRCNFKKAILIAVM